MSRPPIEDRSIYREVRESLGLSQREAAALAGVSQAAVSHAEGNTGLRLLVAMRPALIERAAQAQYEPDPRALRALASLSEALPHA